MIGIEERSDKYLDPQVRKRWLLCKAEFLRRFPNLPQPFLTSTYRDEARQNFYYQNGKSQVRGGYSLHQYGFAFDIAFRDNSKSRKAIFEIFLYQKFAGIAKYYELEWGGDWKWFLDYGHFQAPITIENARAGKQPMWYKLI